MPKIVPLVPAGQGLPAKLDRLAIALADALLADDVPIPMKIAGLKVLAGYRTKRGDIDVVSAFEKYRAAALIPEGGDAA